MYLVVGLRWKIPQMLAKRFRLLFCKGVKLR